MNEEELNEIEKRAFVKATDDELFSNARYVSTVPGEFRHDNKRSLGESAVEKIDPEQVIAITLLQNPDLVYQDQCDENTEFIAHAREDIPKLVNEIRALKIRIVELENK